MSSSLQLARHRWLRQLAFGWHYGALPAGLTAGAAIVALAALAAAGWQGLRADHQAERLSARLAQLQSARAASAAAVQAAEPPDVIRTLPSAPGVAQVMQTLQRAADKEGAHVLSLQADDHPPSATVLGHLDLVVSIKAAYPAILVVIQQVLDRYPGATLRQIQVARVVSSTPVMPAVAMPMPGASMTPATSESEAHVTLSFWRRPLDVEPASPVSLLLPANGEAASATPASASSSSASGTRALPPLAGASGGAK